MSALSSSRDASWAILASTASANDAAPTTATIRPTAEPGCDMGQHHWSSQDDSTIPSYEMGAPFQDVTSELFRACAALDHGQMVAVPNFTLMDSMAAIKIMDVRMDSGMALPPSGLPEPDRLPGDCQAIAFDPFQTLSIDDVLWIMDRLFACEAAWHQGSSLSQTLYTCLYFHSLKSLSPRHPRFQARNSASSSAQTMECPELVCKVLRSFILATVKTLDVVWNELAAERNVIDGEDFSSDKSGLSLLETTDPDYAIAELEDAIEWIQAQAGDIDRASIEATRARLTFRKQLLYAVTLLQNTSTASPLDVVIHCKFARRSLNSLRPVSAAHVAGPALLRQPHRSSAPSVRAMSAFDPAYNRKLVANAPLRPISLPSADATWNILDNLLVELQDVVHILQHPGFQSWKTFFTHRSISYQRRQPLSSAAYVRSLFQTSVCHRNMVAGRLPLDWLAEAFFHEVALVDPLVLRKASRIGRDTVEGGARPAWNSPPSLGQQVHFFVQRLAGNLVSYLTTLSQNRARTKRSLASKLYREWVQLSEEASELGRKLEHALRPEDGYVPDTLFAATQHLALEIMTQIAYSGFELDLYVSLEDCQSMWWLGSRIQQEQALVCADLRDEVSASKGNGRSTGDRSRGAPHTLAYIDRQIWLARALEKLSIATVYLKHLFADSRKSCGTANSGQAQDSMDADPRADAERNGFITRVKWMRLPSRSHLGGGDEQIEALWQDYVAFRKEITHAEKSALLSATVSDMTDARRQLETLVASFDSRQRQDTTYAEFVAFVESLHATCCSNLDAVANQDAILSPPATHPSPTWHFEHPWIPQLTFGSPSWDTFRSA
ncbi:Mak10-domain-containing protein [Testicularia cyperi]|uniref:Mak10-domain-containing protein n=1 Tax=Testicularia cyperi TaxID=1882483 RepID=A0A317XRG0_9BASI|nr:Mak10-domain-containing protein [Testicularia cyperi]